MDFITKKDLDDFIGDKTIIELKDLTKLIEEQFDVVFKIEKKLNVDEMTKILSEDQVLIEKVKNAREKRDPNFSTYLRNKHEFNKFLNEARNAK
ncbi:hypothetical protein M670_03159 [Schinkia azotoformans MEV2011]|uniref:50S ribosomal protein L7/L12 n=1 Tax=Schinkia azotoformans MEV2011 TaxID=1348973 RepID=A0A072NWH1_SCHAZ|nr:hypothetical protein [Schinkia azotoformans]KEF37580.1 hypothetical protein M670_03159 [Schinkia azotoformans MEV2011]MEC1695306.1 hypothetical protein [Schinkia azotoformans]MEC1717893.1 hypothetical protein [Schinkia azotoformans]MEC1724670.1 hypothetical protein [Schinkia azotoformans]MEC1741074.1 hypothetical protein [Schinkia azotoformans]